MEQTHINYITISKKELQDGLLPKTELSNIFKDMNKEMKLFHKCVDIKI